MSAEDRIHGAVRNALIKDGWTITADPFTIKCEGLKVFADLAAERNSPARQEERCIVIEIKSFLGPSPIHDLELALGQYVLYRNFLRLTAPQYELHLAVGQAIYDDLFIQGPIRFIIRQERIHLIVINVQEEVIVSWIN